MTEGDSPFKKGWFLPRLFCLVIRTYPEGLHSPSNSAVIGKRAECNTAAPWLFALSSIRQVNYDFSCTDEAFLRRLKLHIDFRINLKCKALRISKDLKDIKPHSVVFTSGLERNLGFNLQVSLGFIKMNAVHKFTQVWSQMHYPGKPSRGKHWN